MLSNGKRLVMNCYMYWRRSSDDGVVVAGRGVAYEAIIIVLLCAFTILSE